MQALCADPHLDAACEHAAAQFAGASRVAVRTGEGCVLQLELTGRTWLTDAGDGDLPCGEIYIAPVEAKTNGEVFFGSSIWRARHTRT